MNADLKWLQENKIKDEMHELLVSLPNPIRELLKEEEYPIDVLNSYSDTGNYLKYNLITLAIEYSLNVIFLENMIKHLSIAQVQLIVELTVLCKLGNLDTNKTIGCFEAGIYANSTLENILRNVSEANTIDTDIVVDFNAENFIGHSLARFKFPMLNSLYDLDEMPQGIKMNIAHEIITMDITAYKLRAESAISKYQEDNTKSLEMAVYCLNELMTYVMEERKMVWTLELSLDETLAGMPYNDTKNLLLQCVSKVYNRVISNEDNFDWEELLSEEVALLNMGGK